MKLPGTGREVRNGKAEEAPQTSRVRDRYRFGATLGVGSFAVVREAIDMHTQQHWACKIIPFRSGSGTTLELAMREVQVMLAARHHDNVLCLREYFLEDGQMYLITDLLKGGDLEQAVVERGSLSEGDARDIFAQLLGAVKHLHAAKIAHRDIKLENLVLTSSDDLRYVKLIDFGMSYLCGANSEVDDIMTVCGTPAYICPEVAQLIAAKERAALGVSPRHEVREYAYGRECDIWACGVALFMMLTGYPPFYSADLPSLLSSIKDGRFNCNDPSYILLSEDAKDIISKLLDPRPAMRLTAEEALCHPWLLAGSSEHSSMRTPARPSDLDYLPPSFH
eukprot:jgi/Tetstr1/463906/TSEL_008716.t1